MPVDESKRFWEIVNNIRDVDTPLVCMQTQLEELQNAWEKQIPKKPLPENEIYGNGICPNCMAYFMDKSTKFCGNCGQALDWSRDE